MKSRHKVEMLPDIEANHLIPKTGKVFDFDDVNEWMKAQDEALINGKIVVKL